jgi:hypothetical protein
MTEHNKEKQNFKLITKPKALMQIAVMRWLLIQIKMKKNLAFMSLTMMAMMSETNFGEIPKERPRKFNPKKDIEPIKPNGVKEYFFTENGGFFNSMPTGSYTIFYKCFALNDKNAKRKFDAYQKRHLGQ